MLITRSQPPPAFCFFSSFWRSRDQIFLLCRLRLLHSPTFTALIPSRLRNLWNTAAFAPALRFTAHSFFRYIHFAHATPLPRVAPFLDGQVTFSTFAAVTFSFHAQVRTRWFLRLVRCHARYSCVVASITCALFWAIRIHASPRYRTACFFRRLYNQFFAETRVYVHFRFCRASALRLHYTNHLQDSGPYAFAGPVDTTCILHTWNTANYTPFLHALPSICTFLARDATRFTSSVRWKIFNDAAAIRIGVANSGVEYFAYVGCILLTSVHLPTSVSLRR